MLVVLKECKLLFIRVQSGPKERDETKGYGSRISEKGKRGEKNQVYTLLTLISNTSSIRH